MLDIKETPAGVPFVRSPEASFEGLTDYPWPPNHIGFEDLRLHYLDVGPRDGPVALLTHGMPTWSYLNRHLVARLSQAGYRCIAPDHIGFGRSDKVIDDSWYSIARHTRALGQLIEELELRDITLFAQDWGGPTSLAHVALSPERFARLVIMNTWLHHATYDYTPALRQWNAQWKPDGVFGLNVPDRLSLGWLMLLATRRVSREDFFAIIASATYPALDAEADAVRRAYDAPHAGLGHAGHAGPRRFPLSLPFDNPEGGDAEAQARHFAALAGWTKPIHFIWGGTDEVFTEAWGRQWASRFPQASFDLLPDAGHFLQETHGDRIADIFLQHAAGRS